MSLAVFDVLKSVDLASGEVITPVYNPLPGTVRCCPLFLSLTTSFY
jgi:hypothetical protein